MQPWRNLTNRKTYRVVLAIKQMTIVINKVSQLGYYVEFENSQEQLLRYRKQTLFIKDHHNLSSGNVYWKNK